MGPRDRPLRRVLHRECTADTRVDPKVKPRRSFGFALVLASSMVGAGLARARGYGLDELPALRDAGPITVVLHRGGGQVLAGKDDPKRLRSGVVARQGLDWVEVPEFAGDDAEWSELVACVQQEYAEVAIEIVDSPPARGDYVLALVGGAPDMFGFDETVHGIAPWSGRVLDDAVLFVFQSPDTSGRKLCEVTAHEIGHALGLDHSRDCTDTMSYESCGAKHFRETAAACGEWEDRSCGTGRPTQSSADELVRRVGRRDQAIARGPLSFHFVESL